MKNTFVVLVLFILTTTTHAQDWSKVPELAVWYEQINGNLGLNMHYLPNFDTANGGQDAVYHNAPGIGGITIYNRYKGDTTNMFSWQNTILALWQGDFNGDGVTDYCNGNYGIYQGIKFGVPPKLPTVKSFDIKFSSSKAFIADINNDKKDDIFFAESTRPDTSKTLGALLLGNENIQDMEIIYFPFTEWLDFDESAQCLMDAYYLEGKGARVITMTWDKNYASGKLHLWAVDISGDKGKRTVKYSWLSSVKLNISPAQYIASFFKAIHLRTAKLDCFKLHPDTYSLLDDKFVKVLTDVQYGSGGSILLEKPMSKDHQIGWVYGSTNNNECAILCFEGNPLKPNQPIARFPCSITDSQGNKINASSIVPVGDVNKDGINDVACTYTGGKRLYRIYLGVDGNTFINDNDNNNNSITLLIQNPLRKDLPFTLQITSSFESQATIELFSLSGEKMFEIWNGTLQIGSQSIYFDGNKYNVPAGMYNMRLKSDKTIVDKAIIIE